MSLLDDLKAKADANGDGSINADDIAALRGDGQHDGAEDQSMLDQVKELIDQNGDGSMNLDDLKNFDFGGTLDDLKNKFF